MNCPVCSQESRVLKTLETERRRECTRCGHRFTTKEVLKDDHKRQERVQALMQKLTEQL